MTSGAREAPPSRLRRLVARAAGRELSAFVVPGSEVARARGLDLKAASLRLSDTPRHASVLVLVGEVPEGLKKAAAVAYAQMPRPRAIFAVGAGDVSPLPEPDVSVTLGQEALARGVAELRRSFAEDAFAPEVVDFDVDAIQTATEYVCPMHPEIVRSEPGSCPICGMDLTPHETAEAAEHGGAHGDHEMHAHNETEHEEHVDHHAHEETQQEDPGGGHSAMDHGEGSDGQDHAGHGGHEHMDHGDMGFMSMVEMTKDLPRSSDGLQMEWVEVPFGPLFPGLPGGLGLTLTLDGDTVAAAEPVVADRPPTEDLAGPVEGFADRLARRDPLSPVAYRVLACKAVEDSVGATPDERTALARVGTLERERAASHLGWLASFAHLLGYGWLESRAEELQLALLRARSLEEVASLQAEVGKLARRVRRTPLLRHKLGGVGSLPNGVEAFGPVARGAGIAEDARTVEEAYRALSFEPVVREGGDALSRLRVRLAEVEQSLGLVRGAGLVAAPEPTLDGSASGTGAATVETPRGAAKLTVALESGLVSIVELDTPSARHLGLVGSVAERRELADALVGTASLDLSPWEIAR